MSAEPPSLPEDEKTPMVMSRARFWTTSIVMMLILPVLGIGYIFLDKMKVRVWEKEQRARQVDAFKDRSWPPARSEEEFKLRLGGAQIVAIVEAKGDSSSKVKTILLDKVGDSDSRANLEKIAEVVGNWGERNKKVSYDLIIVGEGVMESLGQYFRTGSQGFSTYAMDDVNSIRIGGKDLSIDDISKLLPVAKP